MRPVRVKSAEKYQECLDDAIGLVGQARSLICDIGRTAAEEGLVDHLSECIGNLCAAYSADVDDTVQLDLLDQVG